MSTTLIKGATLVNEGRVYPADLRIRGEYIERIAPELPALECEEVIDASGLHLLPGLIDDQVHFREPGLTHKGDIGTESRAAVAGGITSFMEMPNTIPNVFTHELLEQKYDRAAEVSPANYSFFLGAGHHNLDEIAHTDPTRVCGVKIFMGSSTGDMLVDDQKTLEAIFAESPVLIATHCEDEHLVKSNMRQWRKRYGDAVPMSEHPLIRSAEACYRSSSRAIDLAGRHGARLHILHISTAREVALFEAHTPTAEKKITAEACTHHLWFSEEDYARLGSRIKWNPAVKTAADRAAVRQGLIDGHIDVLATDHAPHTLEEKSLSYFDCPSGGPLVQHALPALLDLYHQGVFTLEMIVQKASHNVATLFQVHKRGFLREGYAADLVLVNLNSPWEVSPENILYKCGWSPFEGHRFKSEVKYTFVNGAIAWGDGQIHETVRGKRLHFDR